MSFNEELVKNYKERQKAIKKIKEEYKEVFKPQYKLNKDLLINSYISGDEVYELQLTVEQAKSLKNLNQNHWKYKDELFRELLEEEEIAIVVSWFETWTTEDDIDSKIFIHFSQYTKKELDKELKGNKI